MVKRTFSYKIKILIKDTSAPEIICIRELSVTEGETIDLLKDVKVVDNSNEVITASVSGEYDFNKPGKYNLKYVAE